MYWRKLKPAVKDIRLVSTAWTLRSRCASGSGAIVSLEGLVGRGAVITQLTTLGLKARRLTAWHPYFSTPMLVAVSGGGDDLIEVLKKEEADRHLGKPEIICRTLAVRSTNWSASGRRWRLPRWAIPCSCPERAPCWNHGRRRRWSRDILAWGDGGHRRGHATPGNPHVGAKTLIHCLHLYPDRSVVNKALWEVAPCSGT